MANQEKPAFDIKIIKLDKIVKRPFSDWLLKELHGVKPEDTITTTHYFVLDITRTSPQGEKTHYNGVKFEYSFTPLYTDDKATGGKKMTGEIGGTSSLDFGTVPPKWCGDPEENIFFPTLLRLIQNYFPEAEIYREK